MSSAEITIKLQNPEHLLLTFLTLLSSDESPSRASPSTSAATRDEPRFRCNGGIVTDQKTGLQWSQDDVAEADLNWSDANAACQALRLGGHDDWRLPTRAELISLVDEERHEPAIDASSFPSCKCRAYWTATPYSASPSAYAWAVYFGYGGADCYPRDDDCRVRAVRGSSREFQGVELSTLHAAWQQARRGKVPSHDQLAFETCWADRLLDLQAQLNAGTWQPLPSTCFVATRPKAREIHAPAFADRVVHHWLVPQLETVFEPGFIHDSYANRTGKGSHAAVRRLRDFVRQVYRGQGGGWFLQLDIANFFNRIHRPTLWAILKPRLRRAGVPAAVLSATHALLRRGAIDIGVHQRCTANELAQVPPHKQLRNAPRGCGIAIGNLSSQFFANVYLDRLDQFAKHTLRARRYLRYVDDFVLVHRDRDQLLEWRGQIEQFLRAELRLELKAEQHLAPLHQGIDFLGYIVHPTHTTVRRRVVNHCRSALAGWEAMHVRDGRIHATPQDLQQLRAIAASYAGHFAHADHHRLTHALAVRFPWLAMATRPRRHRFDALAKPLNIPYRKPS